jgi:hypothetical protein
VTAAAGDPAAVVVLAAEDGASVAAAAGGGVVPVEPVEPVELVELVGDAVAALVAAPVVAPGAFARVPGAVRGALATVIAEAADPVGPRPRPGMVGWSRARRVVAVRAEIAGGARRRVPEIGRALAPPVRVVTDRAATVDGAGKVREPAPAREVVRVLAAAALAADGASAAAVLAAAALAADGASAAAPAADVVPAAAAPAADVVPAAAAPAVAAPAVDEASGVLVVDAVLAAALRATRKAGPWPSQFQPRPRLPRHERRHHRRLRPPRMVAARATSSGALPVGISLTASALRHQPYGISQVLTTFAEPTTSLLLCEEQLLTQSLAWARSKQAWPRTARSDA